ncbi:unnamed protein product [Closterium sp. NIES-65]|nr:unnamed protein product [Closterium sp. NIES-65]
MWHLQRRHPFFQHAFFQHAFFQHACCIPSQSPLPPFLSRSPFSFARQILVGYMDDVEFAMGEAAMLSILVGHTDDAEFAMATSPVAPLVISGGKDHNVLLWNVADHVTSLQSSAALRKPHPAAKPKAKAAAAPSAPSRSAPSASVSSRARADSPARSGGRGGGGGGGGDGDGDGGSAVGDAEKKRKREEVVVKGEEVKEVKEGEKEDGGGEGEKRGRGLEGSRKKEEKEVEGKEGGEGKQEEAKKENGEKEKKVEGEKKVVKEEEGKEKGEDGEEKEGEEKEKGGEGKEEGEGKEKEEGTTVEESKEKDADAPSEALKESEGMDVDKTGGEEGEGGRKSDAVGSDKAGGEEGEEAGGGSKEVKEEKAVEERKEGKSKEEDGTTDGAPTGMVVDEATGGGAGGTGAPGDDEAEADADAAGKPTAAARSSSPSPPLKLGYAPKSTSLAPRGVFKGHTATVEDVCFHPSHSQQFCSVGDDSRLLLWDARTGGEKGPCQRVEKAHDSDVHCVDWNGRNEHMVVTGGADKSVRLFDVRKLGGGPVGKVEGEARGKAKATHAFRGGHQAAVLSVQWCPDSPTVFASCAEDGLVNIWDCSLVSSRHTCASDGDGAMLGLGWPSPSLHVEAVKSSRADGVPPGLLFQHVGHQDRVIEFQWAPKDPWTFASVSSNVNKRRGGGTLQELASRGFVDNLRPPMAAAAELLSAVGRSGDGSNEDDDVELWLVQMPDAKSLDLRALDGAQLHVQAGAGGGAGAQGDARRVEVCRFAPPGAAAVGRGAAGGKGFVWGGQPITTHCPVGGCLVAFESSQNSYLCPSARTLSPFHEIALVSDPLPRGCELALVSDPLPRGGLVAVLPGCDGRPPIGMPANESLVGACV